MAGTGACRSLNGQEAFQIEKQHLKRQLPISTSDLPYVATCCYRKKKNGK